MKKIEIFIVITFCLMSFQSCITNESTTRETIIREEVIPVDWNHSSSERIFSQVLNIMTQNIRRYDYFLYTFSINEKSNENSWNNEIKVTTFLDGETILIVFNYFSLHLNYTDNRNKRIDGLSPRISTMQGSVNEFNSTLDRVSLLLRTREFHDFSKRLTDILWLSDLQLNVTRSEN